MLDLVLVVSCYGMDLPKGCADAILFLHHRSTTSYSFCHLFSSALRFYHTGQLSQNSEFTVALSKFFFLLLFFIEYRADIQTLRSTVEDVSPMTYNTMRHTDP
jgi:hypothetical protein